MFNPARPHLLYASFRRHDTLYCWDVRGDVGVPVQKLMTSTKNSPISSEHSETTNQKLRFDIDLGGKHLSVGDHVCMPFISLNVDRPHLADSPEWAHLHV